MKLHRADSLAKITLAGDILEDEMLAIGRDIERTLLADPDVYLSLFIDLRRAKPPTPEVSSILGSIEERSIETSRVHIAEIVESELVAHQLDRVTETTSAGLRLRHFWQPEPALAWLAEPRTNGASP